MMHPARLTALIAAVCACGPKDTADTTETSGTTTGATDTPTTTTGAPPGPEEACAAFCAYNIMCSDITPDYCAMTCDEDLGGIPPGPCLDAMLAFYLCNGALETCTEEEFDAKCHEPLTALDTACPA